MIGTIIFLIFCTGFAIIYKPFQVHESRWFSFELTMTAYFAITAFPLYGIIHLLKRISYFSNPAEWTIVKEALFIVILLMVTGISVYFAGFILETPEKRWNTDTFLNSLLIASLIAIIPFLFLSVLNYRYLFVTDIIKNYSAEINSSTTERREDLIKIQSQLKKEELEFYPGEFIYAESDANYIIFYLKKEGHIQKKTIRNSISNVEQQLSAIPYFFRSHRAFIVNLEKIVSQKGNTLGYRLKLSGTDAEIPVSRNKTKDFDQIMMKYH